MGGTPNIPVLTEGEALMEQRDRDPGATLVDKGYDGDAIRQDLRDRGTAPEILVFLRQIIDLTQKKRRTLRPPRRFYVINNHLVFLVSCVLIPGARKNDALPPSPTCRNWPEMAGTILGSSPRTWAGHDVGGRECRRVDVWAVGINFDLL